MFDTGAEVRVICPAQLKVFGQINKKPTAVNLLVVSHTEMQEQGMVEATFHNKGEKYKADVYVCATYWHFKSTSVVCDIP